MKILYLTGVFLRWCYQDVLDNFSSIRCRYYLEATEEGKELMKEIDEL